jgi:polysaccharide pyruvyl transferase WcaK-like protein
MYEWIRRENGQTVKIESMGLQCNKILWQHNHIVRLIILSLFVKLIPKLSWRKKILNNNHYLKALAQARIVADITGGDSFSDIYGLKRLLIGSLRKYLVLLCGTDLILLPQTYGPFQSRLSIMLARNVFAKATSIYSRDREGLEQIQLLMQGRKMRAKPALCPDVAFVLDAIRPENVQVQQIETLKAQDQTMIGLNISGLLYNGGYTRNNMFGLACDYRSLVKDIISFFARQPDHYVLLVPHVIPDNMPVENDLDACRAVWNMLPKEIQEKVLVLDGGYDQNEIKYFIGLCDFFLGARMHATIAALSQGVPAVGMAYSKKFAGVFETVGVADSVVDLRTLNESECLSRIEELYQARVATRAILANTIPAAQQKVLSIFETI